MMLIVFILTLFDIELVTYTLGHLMTSMRFRGRTASVATTRLY